MPGAMRPNKKAMKIAYELLKTDNNKRQDKENKITEDTIKAWDRDNQRVNN